ALVLDVDDLVVAGLGRHDQLQRRALAGVGVVDIVAPTAAGRHHGDVVSAVVGAGPGDRDGGPGLGRAGGRNAGLDGLDGDRLACQHVAALVFDVDDLVVAGLGRHEQFQRRALAGVGVVDIVAPTAAGRHHGDVVSAVVGSGPGDRDGGAGLGRAGGRNTGLDGLDGDGLACQHVAALVVDVAVLVVAGLGRHDQLQRRPFAGINVVDIVAPAAAGRHHGDVVLVVVGPGPGDRDGGAGFGRAGGRNTGLDGLDGDGLACQHVAALVFDVDDLVIAGLGRHDQLQGREVGRGGRGGTV